MSLCSYCYTRNITPKHDVGHWWNNPEDSVYVCSDECYTKLKELVDNGTWMTHKPKAIFGKKRNKTSANFGDVPEAITDKKFTEKT